MEITVGMTGEATALVEKEDTAQAVGSGSLLVYATPCMAALMEGAACEAIEQALPQGQTSVGTALNLEHALQTLLMVVNRLFELMVTAVERKKITFAITVSDEAGEIGRATHTRVLVNIEKFLEKTYQKL